MRFAINPFRDFAIVPARHVRAKGNLRIEEGRRYGGPDYRHDAVISWATSVIPTAAPATIHGVHGA